MTNTPFSNNHGSEQLRPTFAVAGSRFQLFDDATMEQRPIPPALVENMIPSGSLAVIFGKEGSAKTFVVLDLAFSIALGIQWNGRSVMQGPVVYALGEGIGGLPKRIHAWKDAHGYRENTGVYFLPESVQLAKAADIEAFIAVLKAMPERPVLVIIDTLARSMVGIDENFGKDMSLVIEGAARIQTEIGATVLLVHHTPKNQLKKMRGSSHLSGAADMTALVTKEKGSPVIRIESDKNKEYGDFKTIELKLQPHLGSCIVSTPSARVSQNENGISSLPSQELKALLILASHRKMGSTDWKRVCEAEGIPEPTFYDVIKKLTAAGFVVRFDEPRNRVFYEITEAGRLSAEAYSNGPIP